MTRKSHRFLKRSWPPWDTFQDIIMEALNIEYIDDDDNCDVNADASGERIERVEKTLESYLISDDDSWRNE